jgi:hypothetical protein
MKKIVGCLILMMMPVFGFCDYIMYETNQGVFILEDKLGFVSVYTKFDDDDYGTIYAFKGVAYNPYKDDEGVKGYVNDTSTESFLIIEAKQQKN